jgi:16S rRNA (cytidine1402-2'-O)-methyltransferase
MPGTLFVVATPIGNLEDLTFRALRTLREVDLIAAEDTRRTARLLAHYEIRKRPISLREHNETRETPRLLRALSGGQTVALVTDAGTPSISDPGAGLVRAARAQGIRIVPIPGASAVAAALSASGYEADQFVFLGFPPSSGPKRDAWFHQLTTEPRTAVFFESPHRIARTLDELASILANRPILVGRELTKAHEEFLEFGIYPKSPGAAVHERGEFTVVVGPGVSDSSDKLPDPLAVVELMGRLTNVGGFSPGDAERLTASFYNVSVGQVAKLIKRGRILVNRQNRM